MLISSGYVCCNACRKLFVHNNSTRGTTHLTSHLESCLHQQEHTHAKNIFHYAKPSKNRKINPTTKTKLDDAVVRFLAYGLRPLSIMNDQTFRTFFTMGMEIGSIYVILDTDSVLCRTTIKIKFLPPTTKSSPQSKVASKIYTACVILAMYGQSR